VASNLSPCSLSGFLFCFCFSLPFLLVPISTDGVLLHGFSSVEIDTPFVIVCIKRPFDHSLS
jgi:hypothetical protein